MDTGFDKGFTPPRYATAREERDFMNAHEEYEQIRRSLISRLEKNENKPIILRTPEGKDQIQIEPYPKTEGVGITFIDDWQLFGMDRRAYRVELNPGNPDYFSGQPKILIYPDHVSKRQGLEDLFDTSFVEKNPRFGDSSETESEYAKSLNEIVRRVFA